jgi:hypothetical protein
MKRSIEIEKLIRDSLAAYERGDVGFTERMTSKQPGVVSIGTDASEYVLDYERIVNAARAEMSGSPQLRLRIGEVRAYEHGDAGWSDGTGFLESDGQSVEIRNTSVYLREAGEWRGVQSHTSIGVPNERMFDPLFQRHKTAS